MDWVGAAFNPMYTDVVPQLQTLLTTAEPTSPEYALANIMWVYTFHKVTDYWGPIPYFNAGLPGTSVPYDPQDKIYDDFFKRLAASAAILKANTGATPFGSSDLIYNGDVSKWLKFCNTLRLRLAIRISKVDPARAQAEGEAAYADGVMTTSPDDDALVKRSQKGDDGNGLSIMSDWNEFRMSASMESYLKGYSDPRMPVYFLPAGIKPSDPNGNGTYQGVRNGLNSTDLTETINLADNNSHAGQRWTSVIFSPTMGTPTHLETPQNVMATAEAYFLRSEGAFLGWNVGGSAKDLYEAGIKQSMAQWGITDATTVATYTSGTGTPVAPGDFLNSPPVSTVPVKWDPTMALQQIATQKWLALYPDGMEAWADYRRGRYLKLYDVVQSDNPDIPDPHTSYIRRIPFLDNEKAVNGDEVTKAVQLLGGPDKVTTPLWWDKN
jgi:hypothetical protein